MPRPLTLLIRRALSALLIAGLALSSLAQPAEANSRIKDIANFEGVRDNILVGYGLVVGLNGTGDDLRKSVFTRESLVGMLERLGVNARDNSLEVDNIAAVMVTAVLPPYSRQGTRIDVNISTIGDASNLQGGTLLVTPMIAADGEVYAVAQGPVAVSGFSAQGAAASVTRGVPTAGRIANGAIVEREVAFQMAQMESVNISLRNPDFTTARRIAQAVNAFIGQPIAQPVDPGTVRMAVPSNYTNNAVGLITDIEQLRVSPDSIAKVVIDEKSGVIVMGENVRINTVAIAQGNLTIRVTETPQVSQPNPFSQGGQTAVVPRTQIEIDDSADRRLSVMSSGVTLQDLVSGLNALGVGPRDMISILQAIKAAGALQADIEVI
ncbi:flagellar basal body P-ring protein FlgI [Oceanibaculum pacificum]|uniref:flagellar basal body P-ring protein FlgI n=1 Tax=Oceanibaculum pacificum TaxID=580166 RepID=UPI0009FC06EB|nr:flagellar basal body P-ring protein FlgI [Oceanibaculum pacificum]